MAAIALLVVLPVAAVLTYDAATKLASSLPDPCAVLDATRSQLGVPQHEKPRPESRDRPNRRECTFADTSFKQQVVLRYYSFGRTWLTSPSGNAHTTLEAVEQYQATPDSAQITRLRGLGDAAFVKQSYGGPETFLHLTAATRRANVVVEFYYIDTTAPADRRQLARDVLAAALQRIRLS